MATAETIAKALGGRKAGGGWTARCPAHDDRTPSLSIRDAEDEQGAGALPRRLRPGARHCGAARARPVGREWSAPALRVPRRTPVERKPDQDDARRSEIALAIWQSAKPAQGTPVETYLASRGIDLPPPDALRFHAGLKHPSGGIWPAMVALVTSGADGTPLAIHRTFLARDGGGKAPVDPQKMMLGPCRGGAVRLADAGRCADGRRRHRDLPRRHAGDRPPGMGGAFDLRAACSRSAGRRARRDRARRWRRRRRGGGARLRLAMEAGRSPRAHRPPAAGDGFQRHADWAARRASRRARNERRRDERTREPHRRRH